MKKIFVFLLTLCFSLSINAQSIDLKISNTDIKGLSYSIIGEIDGVLYACLYRAVLTEYSYYLLKIDPKTLNVTKEIKLEFERIANPQGDKKPMPYKTPFHPTINILDGKLLCGYFTDAGTMLQWMDSNGKLLGTPFATNEQFRVMKTYSSYSVDPKSEYIFVHNMEEEAKNIAPFKWNKSYKFEYIVLDKTFKQVNYLEHDLDKGVLSTLCDLDGNIHIVAGTPNAAQDEYTDVELFTNKRIEDRLEAVSLGVNIPIASRPIIYNNYTFNALFATSSGIIIMNEEGDVEMAGVYHKKDGKKTTYLAGHYLIRVDAATKEVSSVFKDFPKFDYSKNFNEKKNKPMEKLPEYFSISGFSHLPDGSTIIAGQFIEYYASKNEVYYSTAMVFAIDKAGQLKWTNFIPKKQILSLASPLLGMNSVPHQGLSLIGVEYEIAFIFSDHEKNINSNDYSSLEPLKKIKDATLNVVMIGKDGKQSAKKQLPNKDIIFLSPFSLIHTNKEASVKGFSTIVRPKGKSEIRLIEISLTK